MVQEPKVVKDVANVLPLTIGAACDQQNVC